AQTILPKESLGDLEKTISSTNQNIVQFSEEIESVIQQSKEFTEAYIQKVHSQATNSVSSISCLIIEIYPKLGIKASRIDHQLNQIFRDYFTASQHHIFIK
ncbi:MAG: acyl-CoA dehydrogenase, partial [Gelidibacter sp.]